MKKVWICCICFLILIAIFTGCGGPNVKLSGTVRDSIKQDLLSGVQIKVGDKDTFTTEDGRFVLENLLLGENDIQVIMDGYKTVEYSEYILKEGDNFLEVMLEKGINATNSEPKQMKPIPNPPPIPGKPVKERPKLEIFRDYSNCEILWVQGDSVNPGMMTTFQLDGGILMATQKTPGLSMIQTKNVNYMETSPGKWIGIKVPVGIIPPNPSTDWISKFELILQVAQDPTSNFNSIGNGKHDKWDVDKYYIVGYAKDPTSSADGEIWVVSDGPNKGLLISFEGKLTINGSGDAYTIRISKVGKVPQIKVPENVEMMPSIPTNPILKPTLTSPSETPKNP